MKKKYLLLTIIIFTTTLKVFSQNASNVDLPFPIDGFNEMVNCSAIQPDGKILVGGYFSSYNGVAAANIIRLNANGTRDTSFNIAYADWWGVHAIAIQNDGKILVGAGQDAAGRGTSFVRLNSNGTLDTSFIIGTGFTGYVNSITIQPNGKILVGGTFGSYNGGTANRIIRLNSNGTKDINFNVGSGFNDAVRTIVVQSNGSILVGGEFTTFNGGSASYMVCLFSNGSRDTSFGASPSAVVNIIVIQPDGKILVGGGFTSFNGADENRIIRLNPNGSKDTSFKIGIFGFNDQVRTIAIQTDGKILVGGSFTETNTSIRANRIVRLNTNATLDSSFNLGTGFNNAVFNKNAVNTIAIQSNGKILVGGGFTSYKGISLNYIISLNSDASTDRSFFTGKGFDGVIKTIVVQSDGKVLIGGNFTSYNGIAANHIIRLNSDGTVDPNFTVVTGAGNDYAFGVNSIVIQPDGKILAGGNFTTSYNATTNRIIRFNSDGTQDLSFVIGSGFTYDLLILLMTYFKVS